MNLDAQGTLVLDDGVGHARVNGKARSLSLLMIELAGSNIWEHDQLIVSDTLTLRGTVDVQLLEYDPAAGDVFDVLDFANFVSGGYTLELPDLAPALTWDVSEFETVGHLKILGPAAIPEPTTLAILSLATATLLRRRRRARFGPDGV